MVIKSGLEASQVPQECYLGWCWRWLCRGALAGFGPAENQQGSQGVPLKAVLPKFSLKCFLNGKRNKLRLIGHTELRNYWQLKQKNLSVWEVFFFFFFKTVPCGYLPFLLVVNFKAWSLSNSLAARVAYFLPTIFLHCIGSYQCWDIFSGHILALLVSSCTPSPHPSLRSQLAWFYRFSSEVDGVRTGWCYSRNGASC